MSGTQPPLLTYQRCQWRDIDGDCEGVEEGEEREEKEEEKVA